MDFVWILRRANLLAHDQQEKMEITVSRAIQSVASLMIKISQINFWVCINGVVRRIQNVPPFTQGVISRLIL